MTRLLQLLQSIAKWRATAKALIFNGKSLAVALLQRFRGVVARNFNLRPAIELKLARPYPGKRRNSATAGNFANVINKLSVAPHFATARSSCNREAG